MEQVVQQLQQQVQQLQQQLLQQQQQQGGGAMMAEAVAAIRELAAAQNRPTRPMLVDNKGLGRPQTFNGKEGHFQRWSQKFESFVSGVFPEAGRILTWASDQPEEISAEMVADEFGPDQVVVAQRVEGLDAIMHQMHTALVQNCEDVSSETSVFRIFETEKASEIAKL